MKTKSTTEPCYFAVLAIDQPGQGELRARLRPSHRAWLRAPGEHRVVVRLGGPTLDEAGSMNGTLLVVEAACVADVHGFVADDPYTRNGLFAQVDVRPWKWSLGQPEPLGRSIPSTPTLETSP